MPTHTAQATASEMLSAHIPPAKTSLPQLQSSSTPFSASLGSISLPSETTPAVKMPVRLSFTPSPSSSLALLSLSLSPLSLSSPPLPKVSTSSYTASTSASTIASSVPQTTSEPLFTSKQGTTVAAVPSRSHPSTHAATHSGSAASASSGAGLIPTRSTGTPLPPPPPPLPPPYPPPPPTGKQHSGGGGVQHPATMLYPNPAAGMLHYYNHHHPAVVVRMPLPLHLVKISQPYSSSSCRCLLHMQLRMLTWRA